MEVKALLHSMVKIPSVTKDEGKLAKYLVKICKEKGIKAKLDEVGNFISEIGKPESKPCILLLGHMDTVAPILPIKIDEKEGILHGRGSVDAKGPLASFIQCLYELRNLTNGRLIVVGVVEEEGQSTGAHHFSKSELIKDVDYAIIGEPSNTHNITIGYRGSAVISLKIKNAPGHTSNPSVRNSIEDFLTLHQRLSNQLPTVKETGKSRKLTIRPTWLKAHSPDKLEVIYNLRIPYQIKTQEVLTAFRQLVNEFNAEEDFAEITMKIHDQIDPYVLKQKNSLLISKLRAVMEEKLGNPPRLIRKTGTADLNILGNKFPHIPMFAYGPGDSRLDHTNNEHILFSDLVLATDLLLNALKQVYQFS